MALRALGIVLLAVATATPQKTNVVLYQPWSAAGLRTGYTVAAKTHGSCWTNSLTTDRSDAWRCMVGDDIYDPCFLGPTRKTVACAGDPFSKRVLLVALKQPLPSAKDSMSQWLRPTGNPWGLRLTTGETCSFATGATDVAHGMRLNYECKGNDFIAGFPARSKPLWTVHAIEWPNKSRLKTLQIDTAVF